MHNRKSRNKIACSILDIHLNERSVATGQQIASTSLF
jgi:hypothetical protein